MTAAGGFVLVALASAAATALLARLAPRLGWTDAPRGSEAARKRQGRPVPAVGGAAILLALLLALLLTSLRGPIWGPASPQLWGRFLPGEGWRFATLVLACAAGTLDDRRALAPAPKVAAQGLALLPLGLGAGLAHGAPAGLALVVLGLVALNLLNTFDNADGALASLCVLGFAPCAPLLAAACLGFLPFNLDAARARNRASRAPSAYLGDAGAFVLGALVLCVPGAAGLLVLPGLDLARLSLARWRAGSRPWIGDRQHLAHRLEARGLPRPLVALVLCLLALPACLLVARATASGTAAPALLGCAASALLYLVVLGLAPAPAKDARPCPPPERSE